FNLTFFTYFINAFIFRTIFKLPHVSAIRNWTSVVDSEPGFQSQILCALKELNDEDKDCCLIFDSMAIRQQLIWDQKKHKYIGFCDYGNNINLENKDTEATEALVFMLISLKGVWKWPIAYFFKHGMSAMTLAELIKTAFILTTEAGLRIRAVTCDGDSNYKNINNFFPHVTMKYNVRVLLDPCYMLKLARNAIVDYKEFKIENEGSIKWQ
ncbi:THAP domain-containing protein 9, partial [Camponotus floridanus]